MNNIFKIYIFLSISFCNYSFSQSLNIETEKDIIKHTLNQYLENNPNSISSMLKGNKAYKLFSEMAKFSIYIDTLLTKEMKKEKAKKEMDSLNAFSDSISNLLLTKKISVKIIDTLFAYKYVPSNGNLKNKKEWDSIYKNLLEDFKYKKLVGLNSKTGFEYTNLINKQIHYQGEDIYFSPSELDNSFFQYEKRLETKCDNEFCINAYKIYRLVLNSDETKGCYLFSYYCGDGICRDFIFIKKEKGKWHFVNSYKSLIIDDW